ncbi:MAG: methanogenesis marker 14 protein [Methermicoccaceae archaeon]
MIGFFTLQRHKPKFATSTSVRYIDLKSAHKPYYIVASVEVGNTTTKCILTATNLKDGKTHMLTKVVKMTRDVRAPKPDEDAFGKTLSGIEFSRESIAELVRDTLVEACEDVGLNIKEDLHFVVRSTGVVAGFSTPDEVGKIVQALANGCLMAGVPPSRMTPALSKHNLPKKFQPYTNIERVAFNGAVAGVNPPVGTTGVDLVANEMEGELATAGIKEGAKWAGVDFRNPVISIDCGTTLDGRITNKDTPYAKTVGNFCGYAGAIPDEIVKGTGLVDERTGTALELFENSSTTLSKILKGSVIHSYKDEVMEHVIIEKVPVGRVRYGSVPVNPASAEKMDVALIGCDAGENGDEFSHLREIGHEVYTEHGAGALVGLLDEVMAEVVTKLVGCAHELELMYPETNIGITGRAGITGGKPELILKRISAMRLFDKPENHLVFVDDGLARGAAVMARCMNSLGTPRNPIGGVAGGACVMGGRIKLQRGK